LNTWAQQSDFFQAHISSLVISKVAFSAAFSTYVQNGPEYLQTGKSEQELFNQKLKQVIDLFHESFFTDFFLQRLLNIPTAKIVDEVMKEEVETTAGNLCSIYYYARGEEYTKRRSDKP
jgi:hypothetical protein